MSAASLLFALVTGNQQPINATETDVLYIHVGKTGGTFLDYWLWKQEISFTEAHMWRPSVDDSQYSRYVVWVRDPVERFRSAYDYSRAVILTDTTGMTEENFHRLCHSHTANCLEPWWVLNKVLTGHAYDAEYERLILHFKDANQVAEALSTCASTSATQRENCQLAWKLMHHPAEHINKGVGWYLHDGAFIQEHADRIFVGTLENLEEDLERLSSWLNVSHTKKMLPRIRASPPSNRHLSYTAQANIQAYYNKSWPASGTAGKADYVSADYEAMRGLVRAGLLRAHQYDLLW
mmetsp:Transcript_28818/g.93078  ORF Transcript_28818/g.93078 Transcript_28818/m.93078 type:complete len:293 (+) Transcript_28818:89-967(+)